MVWVVGGVCSFIRWSDGRVVVVLFAVGVALLLLPHINI